MLGIKAIPIVLAVGLYGHSRSYRKGQNFPVKSINVLRVRQQSQFMRATASSRKDDRSFDVHPVHGAVLADGPPSA